MYEVVYVMLAKVWRITSNGTKNWERNHAVGTCRETRTPDITLTAEGATATPIEEETA